MIRHLQVTEIELILPLSRQVNALHEAQHPHQYRGDGTPEEVRGFFAEKLAQGAVIFVDEVDGQLRGFLLAVPVVVDKTPFLHASKHVELDQICVDATCRGQGIGQALVAEMERWMLQAGFEEWKSMVHGFNRHSQNLMQGQGADVYGIRYRKCLS